jgi:hypothetical protein
VSSYVIQSLSVGSVVIRMCFCLGLLVGVVWGISVNLSFSVFVFGKVVFGGGQFRWSFMYLVVCGVCVFVVFRFLWSVRSCL